jgi:hypothetical protein
MWAANRNTESHRSHCAAELGRALQFKVALGGVEYPEPGAVRYTNLVVAELDTDAPILRAEKVDVYTTQSALAIVVSKLAIESGGDRALAELLRNRLRDRTDSGDSPLRLFVSELSVASAAGSVSLQDLRAQIEPTTDGRQAHCTFHTAEMASDAEPVALTIARLRNGQTGVRLQTQGAFQNSTPGTDGVLELLRTLVSDDHVIVPVSQEAEALLNLQ